MDRFMALSYSMRYAIHGSCAIPSPPRLGLLAGGILHNCLCEDMVAWWGSSDAMTNRWRIVAVLVALLACAAGLGKEAKKKAPEADKLRRAIGGLG